jgi:hypothetical protein
MSYEAEATDVEAERQKDAKCYRREGGFQLIFSANQKRTILHSCGIANSLIERSLVNKIRLLSTAKSQALICQAIAPIRPEALRASRRENAVISRHRPTWRYESVFSECIGDDARIDPTELPPHHAARSSSAAPFRASMALTLFRNALSKTRLPMVLSTKPSSRPLRFLPSRTTITSMSVLPSGRGAKV